MRALSRLRRDRRGISAVELALALPILLLVVGGIVDHGRMLWYQADLTQALRAGMQHALRSPDDNAGILDAIRASTGLSGAKGFSLGSPSRSCTCLDSIPISCSTGWCVGLLAKREYMTLSASYSFTPVVGTMMGLVPDRAEASLRLRVK